ncbi:ectoine synthase [Rhodovulum sulfidophilum]|uniref:ectoine synthase n=1 Tax=Rhodovulum sulfidophilum TaxID=35806 RepID=UPI0005A76C5E|nr:ectoine synthase [Rhodovulum sulfidophilum]ANB35478.1 L-ectoine synthase [Rhodovulum sulfidophilum DSM 1374]ANB39298.1 L-ectoine synthase [Rhodovulum sulfidophilum]MBL3553895.1 ectoine synthase [Rhodovulum sulfidophilum]MBL3584817.1 ectoine synthase [Rhodovulum sulfidophilum]MBL3595743.1 ectoine synthase [Rhodovulum sulfidophilum]
MIVRDFHKLKDTDRAVSDARWTSVRMLLADDGMGFSFHITVLQAGSEHTFHYKHHFESVYCISGKGSITDLASGETYQIRPGVMYALDQHDHHTLRAEEELVMACCFNPPVTGTEVHREDGSYAPVEELAD